MIDTAPGVLGKVNALGAALLLDTTTGRLRAVGLTRAAVPKLAKIMAEHPGALRQALVALANTRE